MPRLSDNCGIDMQFKRNDSNSIRKNSKYSFDSENIFKIPTTSAIMDMSDNRSNLDKRFVFIRCLPLFTHLILFRTCKFGANLPSIEIPGNVRNHHQPSTHHDTPQVLDFGLSHGMAKDGMIDPLPECFPAIHIHNHQC